MGIELSSLERIMRFTFAELIKRCQSMPNFQKQLSAYSFHRLVLGTAAMESNLGLRLYDGSYGTDRFGLFGITSVAHADVFECVVSKNKDLEKAFKGMTGACCPEKFQMLEYNLAYNFMFAAVAYFGTFPKSGSAQEMFSIWSRGFPTVLEKNEDVFMERLSEAGII